MNPLAVPDPGLYVWTIITFLILLVVFNKLAWQPLKGVIQAREQLIRKSLDDAHQAKKELERLHVESQKILTEARVQADKILSETRSDANRLRDELKQKAQTEATGIIKNAERQIEMETARAAADSQRGGRYLGGDRVEAARAQRDQGRQRPVDRGDVQADRGEEAELSGRLVV